MKLPVKLDHPKAVLPEFKTDGAACFDLTAVSRSPIGSRSVVYDTGVVFDIPGGYHIKVYSRSGHGFNDSLRLANAVGVIDSDYRGPIKVKLTYDGPPHGRPDWPMVGDRVAQAMLVKNVKTEIVEVEEVSETERGENGFGSTGK